MGREDNFMEHKFDLAILPGINAQNCVLNGVQVCDENL